MEDDDWKNMIHIWIHSQQHKKIKKKLKSRRMYTLNTKEILEAIKAINEFDSLSDEEKESIDWLDPEMQSLTSKKQLIQSLIESLSRWHFYMRRYELTQEYEICAKIRDVVSCEVSECRRMVKTYFILEDEDEEIFQMLREESKKSVYENYESWNEYLNLDNDD
jgi:galactokinase